MKANDASQAWILVILIGAAVAAIAWFIDVVQEWMSDLKLGYCTTNWRLNSNFCCWENKGTHTLCISVHSAKMNASLQKKRVMLGKRGPKYSVWRARLRPTTLQWPCILHLVYVLIRTAV